MRKLMHAVNSLPLARMWPQAPIGLLLLFTGGANIFAGLKIYGLTAAYQMLVHVAPLSRLNQEVSLAILGRGVQVLLGAGMAVAGIGSFWRLRSAWAFSVLLLSAAAAVDLCSHRSIYSMLPLWLSLAALVIWHSRFERLSLVGAYLMSFMSLSHKPLLI
ncbi:MAG: hypothetical protein KGI84_07135 [Elusimicrobia bacterium]|nr:hypothetical protein [Elusimicrobiota bacterium]